MDLEKMIREEKELEALAFGSAEENPTEETVAPSPVESEESDLGFSEPEAETTTVISQPEDLTDGTESPKKTRTSWKKRYTSYKATTDATIYNLRQENASLKNDVANVLERAEKVRDELASVKQSISQNEDPFKGLITKEDEELLGEEALDVMKRIAGKKKDNSPELDALRAELNEVKKERRESLRREQENLQSQSANDFKSRLMNSVERFSEIDNDPDFHAWLQEMDEYSDVPRANLFGAAIQSRDVRAASRFYSDFETLKPKTREQILSEKVQPTGKAAGDPVKQAGASPKAIVAYSEYNQFMDDVVRGKYKGRDKERAKLDLKFDRAISEHRMDYNM